MPQRLWISLLYLFPLLSNSHTIPIPQHIFSNPTAPHESTSGIPSIHESAIQARRILSLERIGTLSTIFPSSDSSDASTSTEHRPSNVAGLPIGLMEYFADCEDDVGTPTLLAVGVATSFRNAEAGSNMTLSLRWHPPNAASRRYSEASMPRMSLVGRLEPIPEDVVVEKDVVACYVDRHPDAIAWVPGNAIHESSWARLVVEEVYWIGGFGDRAYIGWLPIEEWRGVTAAEIERCRLPGEKESASWGRFLQGSLSWDL